MAIAEILFNDVLSADDFILTARVGGVEVAGTKMLDGDVSSCVPGANQITCTPRTLTTPSWNALGLINLPGSAARITAETLDTQRGNLVLPPRDGFVSGGGNHILWGGTSLNYPRGSGFRINSTLPSLCPAEIYLGSLHQIEVFYPKGFRPPILQPTEDDILLSENGLPIARHTRRVPFETEIPFRFTNSPEAFTPILKRMQTENFLWRWQQGAPVLYCWPVNIGEWEYIAPAILELTVRLRGYFEYENIGAEVGGATGASGAPNGETGGARLAPGWNVNFALYEFALPGEYAEVINPRGGRQHIFRNPPSASVPVASLRAPPLADILNSSVSLSAADTRQGIVADGTTAARLVPWARPAGMLIG